MRALLPVVLVLAACEEHGSTCTNGLCDGPGPSNDTPNGTCADDSALEPNNTLQTAFVVPAVGNEFSLASLAICPLDDRDIFAIDVPTPNVALNAIATTSGLSIRLSILDSAGNEIVAGITQVCAANVPAARFFVEATGQQAVDDYKLTIQIRPTCP